VRFSLKWILAGMAYAAIAAAAFARGEWWYADALCVLTLLAFVYAVLVTAFARGRRQIAAAGFVVGCVCLVLGIVFGGNCVPTERWLIASGVGQKAPTTTSLEAANVEVQLLTVRFQQARSTWDQVLAAKSRQQELQLQAVSIALAVYRRAANAVATLGFGLMGSLMGLMAFRAARRDAQ
jgi:hypothetical protein